MGEQKERRKPLGLLFSLDEFEQEMSSFYDHTIYVYSTDMIMTFKTNCKQRVGKNPFAFERFFLS